MPQTCRPDTDALVGNYTDNAAGTSNIYTKIDEAVADDADYIQSPATPVNEPYVARLSDVTDPVSSSSHIVRFRYSTNVASGGETLDLLVELRQGYTNEGSKGTLIASKTVAGITGTTWTADSFTLSGGEADSITDYTALFIRIVWNKP
jgi:hypothetical protein